ncbi:hypothetical protein SAMN05518848_11826 [Paenibacillus sp. PDC88]|nr:hypothetical protein SAMN05518848_11826 [Paenibacillus sp. PDC88]
MICYFISDNYLEQESVMQVKSNRKNWKFLVQLLCGIKLPKSLDTRAIERLFLNLSFCSIALLKKTTPFRFTT